MNSSYVLLPALAIILGACSQETEAQEAMPTIEGFIDQEFYEALKEAVRDGHKEIRLQSPGGNEQVALDAGALIAESDMTINIIGVCASSCSQYLLPFAEEIRLSGNAVIVMHANSFGMVEEGYVSPNTPNWELLSTIHEKTRVTFERFDVNPNFLTVATRASMPLCYLPPVSEGRRERVVMRFTQWVPTVEDLLGFGWHLAHDQDLSEAQSQEAVTAAFVSTARIRFSEPNPLQPVEEILPCERSL